VYEIIVDDLLFSLLILLLFIVTKIGGENISIKNVRKFNKEELISFKKNETIYFSEILEEEQKGLEFIYY